MNDLKPYYKLYPKCVTINDEADRNVRVRVWFKLTIADVVRNKLGII